MSKRWSYAVLVVAMGCGNTPINNTPVDAQVGNDVVGQDVVDAGGGGGQDVVDAGGARPDVVDAAMAADVVDAAMAADVVDAAMATDVPVATDVPAAMDVPADVVMTSVGCAMPLGTITLPGTVMPLSGTTRGASTLPSTTCQSSAGGAENVYTLNVTSRTGVIVSTANMGTSFDTVLSIRRTCADGMTELTCDDDGGPMPSTASTARAVLEPGMYSVVVDGFSTNNGNYVLSASTFTPAANATCATAAALAPGATLAMQSLEGTGAPVRLCNVTSASGPLYYTVTVPASSRVDVTVTPTVPDGGTAWTPSVRVVDSCMATDCVLARTGTTAIPLINGSMSPRTFTLMVANNSRAINGSFSISASMASAVVVGTDCAAPRVLTPGMDLTGQDTSVGLNASTLCASGSTGGQLFYQLTVPAGQYARVSAATTGMTARASTLRVLNNCPATACEDFNTSTTTTESVAFVANTGTTPRTAIVSLAASSTTTQGTFTVRAAVNPITAGAACAAPVALTAGMTLNGNTGNGYQLSRACNTTETGPQSFYALTIPARQRSRVVVTPAMGAMYTARLRVLDTCAATSCVASPSSSTAGAAVETTVNNDTDMPRNVIVSVAATNTMNPGAFTIAATNSPIPGYTVTSIPAACDDLSMGMALSPTSGGWTDDNVSANAALPFTFPLFAEPATHFTVSSNGFLQLHANAMGTGLSSFSNTTLPNSSTPNGVIAAFWDDLYAIDMTTGVRSATLGTMPNRRFVVEWANWETGEGSMGETLTFQAKLFETTGTVEIHHCNIAGAGTRSRGDSATVGIENLSGTLGSLVSLNMANSVTTMTGRRFTVR